MNSQFDVQIERNPIDWNHFPQSSVKNTSNILISKQNISIETIQQISSYNLQPRISQFISHTLPNAITSPTFQPISEVNLNKSLFTNTEEKKQQRERKKRLFE